MKSGREKKMKGAEMQEKREYKNEQREKRLNPINN